MAKSKIDYIKRLSTVFKEADEVYVPWRVIEYKPPKNETVENAARKVLRMMKEMELDAVIHFPEFSLEVNYDMTQRQIVNSYYEIMDEIRSQHAADKRANKKNKPQGPKK